jgi:hypothetical protein
MAEPTVFTSSLQTCQDSASRTCPREASSAPRSSISPTSPTVGRKCSASTGSRCTCSTIQAYWKEPSPANRGGDPGDAGTADDDLAVHARRPRHDPLFLPAGAEAFKRDIPDAEVRFLDTGHFALETHVEEIAGAIGEFLTR